MGIVWRAHDEFLDREVAIKEVRYADMLGEDNQEDFNRRTKREARAAGRLTHPNVVVVHDVVEEDGRPWIVMQLVESRSLGKVMRQDGPSPPKRVAEIGLHSWTRCAPRTPRECCTATSSRRTSCWPTTAGWC